MALVKDVDYYIDNGGLLVFTERYLRERGFCCENGCRHCPYGKETGKSKQDPDLKTEDEDEL